VTQAESGRERTHGKKEGEGRKRINSLAKSFRATNLQALLTTTPNMKCTGKRKSWGLRRKRACKAETRGGKASQISTEKDGKRGRDASRGVGKKRKKGDGKRVGAKGLAKNAFRPTNADTPHKLQRGLQKAQKKTKKKKKCHQWE